MPLITAIADRLVALDQGRLIAAGPPDEVLHHPVGHRVLPGRHRSGHRPLRTALTSRRPPTEIVRHRLDRKADPMQPSTPPPARSSALRRYGPLIAIVVGRGRRRRGGGRHPEQQRQQPATGHRRHHRGRRRHPAGVALVHRGQGRRASRTAIDWGTGATPPSASSSTRSYFAGDCYAPFTRRQRRRHRTGRHRRHHQGGAVPGPAERPDPQLHHRARSRTPTPTTRPSQTIQDWTKFYETYYETYGRKVELVPFTATGDVHRRGGGPGRRHHHRRGHQALRRVGRPDPDHGLRRRAGRPQGAVHRLRARPASYDHYDQERPPTSWSLAP